MGGQVYENTANSSMLIFNGMQISKG